MKFRVMFFVKFSYADVKAISLRKRAVVKGFVADIFREEGKELYLLTYIFCSDSYLLAINRDFLNHDFYTDVITFDLSEEGKILGEVYISLDRVKENAASHTALYRDELLRVIFHGALHLCGYKDKKKSEITLMRQKEDYYLRMLREKML